MTDAERENELLKEFAECVESAPSAPRRAAEEAMLRRITADLRRSWWRVCAKLTLFQVSAGLVTLLFCPQFGFGFGHVSSLLHDAHTTAPPLLFYLLCGVLFVGLGALLSGLVLERHELRQVGRIRYRYFFAYSILIYLTLVALGTEAFVLSSLAWIPGAVLGNTLGFALTSRLAQRLT